MLKRYQHFVSILFRLVDASVVGLVWLASYWLRFNVPIIEVTKGFPSFETYAALTPLIILFWMAAFSAMRVYQSSRLLRRTHEIQRILKAHAVATILFLALAYLFSEYRYSRAVMIYFAVLGAALLVFFRLLLRNLLRQVRKRGHNLRYALMVGQGPAIEALIYRLERFPELGLRVKGVVTASQDAPKSIQGKPVLGTISELDAILKKDPVDLVVLSFERGLSDALDQALEVLKTEAVDIQLVPDLHEYITLGCAVEDFDGIPIVKLNDSPLDGWGSLAKRATDVLVSAITLILISPLLLVIGALVKLTSKGPIFYSQERMGLDGRTFKMIKFRSMKLDAESGGAQFAKKDDNRKTAFGSFLRATSLDELPQKEIPNNMLRHKVKAGITGWAHINGRRGDTSLEKRIECDLYYIRNWSYGLDWKILLLTLWKGFINKNAY